MTTRRTFLSMLATLPFVGRMVRMKTAPEPERIRIDFGTAATTVVINNYGWVGSTVPEPGDFAFVRSIGETPNPR